MIVLDTTVLIYAKGADHSLRSPCQALLTAVAADGIEATTTPEVIQEFVHVWARRRTRGEAATLARAFVDLLSPLLVQEEPHLVDGIALFERHSRLGAFDAVLAAAAIESGAAALVSANRTFSGVRGLRHVDPGTPDLDRLLR